MPLDLFISWDTDFITDSDDSYRLNLFSRSHDLIDHIIYPPEDRITNEIIRKAINHLKLTVPDEETTPHHWELISYDDTGKVVDIVEGGIKVKEEHSFSLGWGAEMKHFNLPDNPAGKFKLDSQVTFSSHRSGWAYAIDSLKGLHNSQAEIFLDGFVENNFSWRRLVATDNAIIPYKTPWIGFVHNPFGAPDHFMTEHSPETYMEHYEWLKSLTTCKGLFCLSHHHADRVRRETGKLVSVVKHPTETHDVKIWNLANYEHEPVVMSIGWWLRNLRAIEALETPDVVKVQLWPYRKSEKEAIEKIRELKDKCIISQHSHQPVHNYYAISNESYDHHLAKSVVFIDLYASSANNAVIECIARGTPICINKLPSIVEYLGNDYPLYFNDYGDASRKIRDKKRLLEAHHQLMALRPTVTKEAFILGILESEVYQSL